MEMKDKFVNMGSLRCSNKLNKSEANFSLCFILTGIIIIFSAMSQKSSWTYTLTE
jgi:hypothetical protein